MNVAKLKELVKEKELQSKAYHKVLEKEERFKYLNEQLEKARRLDDFTITDELEQQIKIECGYEVDSYTNLQDIAKEFENEKEKCEEFRVRDVILDLISNPEYAGFLSEHAEELGDKNLKNIEAVTNVNNYFKDSLASFDEILSNEYHYDNDMEKYLDTYIKLYTKVLGSYIKHGDGVLQAITQSFEDYQIDGLFKNLGPYLPKVPKKY